MGAYPPNDMVHFLQAELERKRRVNPLFSMRAFAHQLGLESSALSKILAQKRSISGQTFRKIREKLSLNPEQTQFFARSLTERRGRKPARQASRKPPTGPKAEMRQLTMDQFHLISDWYHFALLELVELEGFRPRLPWIARTLGISRGEAKAALERLQRLGYLEITADGRWLDCSGALTNTQSGFSDPARRNLQAQILRQALASLEEVPFGRRSNSSMTMAIDSRLLPEAAARIKRFRRELCQFLQSSESKDAVFQLSVALFPVTRPFPKPSITPKGAPDET